MAVAHRRRKRYRCVDGSSIRNETSSLDARGGGFLHARFFFSDPADDRNAERRTERTLEHLKSGGVLLFAQL